MAGVVYNYLQTSHGDGRYAFDRYTNYLQLCVNKGGVNFHRHGGYVSCYGEFETIDADTTIIGELVTCMH